MIQLANKELDNVDVYNLINEAYYEKSLPFKKEGAKRLESPLPEYLNAAYDENRVLIYMQNNTKAGDNTYAPRILAVIVYDLNHDEKKMNFGPFAVHPHHQGKGVGKIMFE